MTDIVKPAPAHERDAVALGLAPCPDCDEGVCAFNCGPGSVEVQRVLAAGVNALERIERDQKIKDETRSAEMRGARRMLAELSRLNPELQDLSEKVAAETARRRKGVDDET